MFRNFFYIFFWILGRQEEGGLVRQILEEQLEMNWPGLASEVADICKKILIPDASRMDLEKETI